MMNQDTQNQFETSHTVTEVQNHGAEMLHCNECDTDKPRSEFPNCDKPTMCSECRTARRRQKKAERKSLAEPVKRGGKSDEKRDRITAHVSLQAQCALQAMAASSDQSKVVETAIMNLLKQYPQEVQMFAGFLFQSKKQA